jgi:hypothetical protein
VTIQIERPDLDNSNVFVSQEVPLQKNEESKNDVSNHSLLSQQKDDENKLKPLYAVKKWDPADAKAYGSDEDKWNAVCDEMNVEELDEVGIADCEIDSSDDLLSLPEVPVFNISTLETINDV